MVSFLQANRLCSSPRWLISVFAVLAAGLTLQVFSVAQTTEPDPAKTPSATEVQSTLDGAGQTTTEVPLPTPDATGSQLATAAQVEAAGRRDASNDPDAKDSSPVPALSPSPAVVKSESPSPATPMGPGGHAVPLQAKYDVSQIGQRNVGSGLDFYSLDREVALGHQLSQEVEQQARLVTDPVITEYVNRIGQNLVRNSDARVPFTIKVLDNDEVNAFALPGGFFYVDSGLILAADNEAELAGVMAHEIAHVAARHATKNMTRAQIWNMASIPLIFIGGPVAYAISEVASLAVPLGFLKFSRDAEREADLLGLEYDYAAGYDPEAFVEFFEKLKLDEKKKQNFVAKAFATHPMNADRIKAAQDEIRKYLPDRSEYVVDTSEFEGIKLRLASLENSRRLGGAKGDPSRPVLLKRTSSSGAGSGNTAGQKDDGSATDQNDDGRPTLKRTPPD
jgi:beta-barrel assembly-enhancing protease